MGRKKNLKSEYLYNALLTIGDRVNTLNAWNQMQGLTFIADRLNDVLYGVPPELKQIWKNSQLAAWEAYLAPWKVMELITETMTDQARRERTLWTGKPWDLNKRTPLPEVAVEVFNELAEKNPISLKLDVKKTEKTIEPSPGHYPTTEMQEALWFLWNFFFSERGWERLKRCPKCMKWFVDDTRNKRKIRCSRHCTWQWWSRDRRKQEGHGKGKRRKEVNHGSHKTE